MMREVIVTNKCSLHCKHCGGPYIFPKFENTGNIVDAIERLSALSNDDTICFAANESLVNPTSARRVKTIIDRFPYKKFVMYTNLVYILTDTKLDILKKCDTVVSFDLKTRFSNVRELFLWYHNAKKLLKTTDAGIGICITKYFKKDKIEKSFKLFDKMGSTPDDSADIPAKCYDLLLTKSKSEQEQIYRIILELDKYKDIHM